MSVKDASVQKFYIWMAAAILTDQCSKIWIRLHLKEGDSLVVWKGVLEFVRYENSGMAFSLFQGYGRWFIPAAIIFVGIVLYLLYRGLLNSPLERVGAACLAGGAIGNAIDRTLFNQVTDFIHFYAKQGILNMADYAINIGILLFVLQMVLSFRRSRDR
ncbi:signal peptidase II [Paenibacillus hexagrammi]|uniref:Lipoprotein signal peptidase n=1 Tax=Paenibacillus hexagrammi TaxID=2908839 RepID=A0ABY3SQZ1_9BACL|nr:signal peptidase II [Paenibacillus sp. YPD9-1]UJF35820.1 signal peptidase II [Paenibacillus sp. YPD9-1]